jgi:predicted DNA-binding transcriptional regulator AlpA
VKKPPKPRDKRERRRDIAKSRKKPSKDSTAKPRLPQALVAVDKKDRIAVGLVPVVAHDQLDRRHVHGARGPPAVRLLDKGEVCAIANVSFPTLWLWMRQGRFQRSRVVRGGGNNSKSVWLSTEVEEWLRRLPIRPLKGDPPLQEEDT